MTKLVEGSVFLLLPARAFCQLSQPSRRQFDGGEANYAVACARGAIEDRVVVVHQGQPQNGLMYWIGRTCRGDLELRGAGRREILLPVGLRRAGQRNRTAIRTRKVESDGRPLRQIQQ